MNIFNKRGDTIIEVMIAIIILGGSLGAAFAIANRSSLNTQANHERFQAQLYANQQAEALREAYVTHIDGGGSRGAFTAPKTCYVAGSWTDTCTAVNGIYTIDVSAATAAGAINSVTTQTYRIVVSWDKIGGGQRQQLELYYGL